MSPSRSLSSHCSESQWRRNTSTPRRRCNMTRGRRLVPFPKQASAKGPRARSTSDTRFTRSWRDSLAPYAGCVRVVILWAILLFPLRVLAQFAQQGPKLVGTGADSAAVQGCSVAISGDGSTAIVGGETDDVFTGATWVWTRRGGTWSQQGHKLIGGSGGDQGASVALSADGNTAIVGEPGAINLAGDDFALSGGATVWTRNGGVWTNQAELLGAGIVNATLRSWLRRLMTVRWEPRGSGQGAAESGRSRAPSWSAPVSHGHPGRERPYPCRRMGTP